MMIVIVTMRGLLARRSRHGSPLPDERRRTADDARASGAIGALGSLSSSIIVIQFCQGDHAYQHYQYYSDSNS